MVLKYVLIGSGVVLLITGLVLLFDKHSEKNNRRGFWASIIGLVLVILPFLLNDKDNNTIKPK